MKTINKIKNEDSEFDFEMRDVFEDIQYPCWTVRLENADNRKEARWSFSVSFDRFKKDFSLDLGSLGNVRDNKFWSEVTSIDFAEGILSAYRESGKSGVRALIKDYLGRKII